MCVGVLLFRYSGGKQGEQLKATPDAHADRAPNHPQHSLSSLNQHFKNKHKTKASDEESGSTSGGDASNNNSKHMDSPIPPPQSGSVESSKASVDPAFIQYGLHLKVDIILAPQTTMKLANRLATHAREVVKQHVPNVLIIDVDLELTDTHPGRGFVVPVEPVRDQQPN